MAVKIKNMTVKIKCQIKKAAKEGLKIKIIKAPLVDSLKLKQVIFDRARALVL